MEDRINVWSRHNSRRLIIQGLFAQLMNPLPEEQTIHNTIASYKGRYETQYYQDAIRAILNDTAVYDSRIEPFLINMTIAEVTKVELCILRLGTYELLSRSDIPRPVIMNEAVKLARIFGANASHKFINGVLDKLADQIRGDEPRYTRRDYLESRDNFRREFNAADFGRRSSYSRRERDEDDYDRE